MSFPLLFTVGHKAFDPTATDDFGNPIKAWAAPVTKQVYGWGAPQGDEPKLAGHDRVVVQVELLVPPGFECASQDRMVLDGIEYEAVGPVESYDHNPFGWNPGGVVNLVKVDG